MSKANMNSPALPIAAPAASTAAAFLAASVPSCPGLLSPFALMLFNQSCARGEDRWEGQEKSAHARAVLLCNDSSGRCNKSSQAESHQQFVTASLFQRSQIDLNWHWSPKPETPEAKTDCCPEQKERRGNPQSAHGPSHQNPTHR